MPFSEGRTGPQKLSPGASREIRLSQFTGEQVVTPAHSTYLESVFQGNVFTATGASFLVAATHVSPLAAGTGTPIIGILNPANSGKVAVIQRVNLITATAAGNPGFGVVWNYILNPVITAVANVTPVNNYIGQGAGSVMKVFSNLATTGSTVGVLFRPLLSLGNGAAATAPVATYSEDQMGDIIVAQGMYLALAAVAAGTTWNVIPSITYEEVTL